jgi:hypothetical protein
MVYALECVRGTVNALECVRGTVYALECVRGSALSFSTSLSRFSVQALTRSALP